MKKNIKKIFHNKNVIMIFCVLGLTALTLSFSYAAFFTVKTNKNNQTIMVGDLSVGYGGMSERKARSKSGKMNIVSMLPMSDADGMAQTQTSIIYIQNEGSLDASYVLTIGYDLASFLNRSDYKEEDVLTPIDYIKFAIYEYSGSSGSNLIAGPLTLADLPVYKVDTSDSRNNRYAILFDSLGTVSDTTKTYQIKLWLSDKATASVKDSYFYINSEVVVEAKSARMSYNLKGSLRDSLGNSIKGAEISVQNNSLITNTDENSVFEINSLLPGTYNVNITNNGEVYEGNLTIREGDNVSLSNIGTSFIANNSLKLADAAYTYGTTINKLMKSNDIKTNANMFTFEDGVTYNLIPSFVLSGGYSPTIDNIVITLNSNKTINFTLN